MPTVQVAHSDAQDLYRKLADPQFAGYRLLLSGTYVLTASGEGAATRGYIVLTDRHLLGTNVMTQEGGIARGVQPGTETLVDGTSLVHETEHVAGSEGLPSFDRPRALIAAMNGNAIEGISVKWNNALAAGGAIRILGGNGARVARCRIEAPSNGIFVNNVGKNAEGTLLTAEITETFVKRTGTNPGILIANLVTRNARSEVSVSRCRVEGAAGIGQLRMQNQNSEHCEVRVTSSKNRFTAGDGIQGASWGVVAFGATAAISADFASSDNQTHLKSSDDIIEGCGDANNGGGIVIRGGSINGNGNFISAEFHRPRIAIANTVRSIAAFGFDPTAQNLSGPGSGNRVRLLVRQCEYASGGRFVAKHQIGVNAANNKVEVVGNAVAWQQTNGALPKPADPDDSAASFFTGSP